MIDREADGSDSLEVRDTGKRHAAWHILIDSGIHDASFYSRRYWIWFRILSS